MTGAAVTWIAARPRRAYLLGAALVLALAYSGQCDGDYVWDDAYLIQHNASLTAADGLQRIFTTDLWGGAGRPRSELYHPLPMATFWLQSRDGLVSVVGGRVVNLGVHVGVGFLLLMLLLRLGMPALAAVLLSLVFVAHPSSTEPIMWLTGRHDLLGALCSIGALVVWPRSTAGHPWSRVLGAASLTAGALLSKEPYVVLPGLLLALSWVERPRRWIEWGYHALPIGAVLGVFLWRRHLGIQSGSDQLGASLPEHLRNAASIFAHYGGQLFRLGNGATIESYTRLSPFAGMAILTLTTAIGITLVALRARPAARTALFGLTWMLVSLSPHVLSLPLIGLWANRYAYFPLAGLLVVAGAGCAAAREAGPPRRSLVFALVLIAALVTGIAISRTRAEAASWHDDVTLYEAAVVAHPADGRALYHYGYAIERRAGPHRAPR